MPGPNPILLPLPLRLLRRLSFPRKLGLCDRLFGKTLSAHGRCWVETFPGPIWKLDMQNRTHRWIVYGYYEGPAFWRWLTPRAAQISTIVDSGANIGQTVLYFSRLIPHARIFAYEPGNHARDWLAESVSANALAQVLISPHGLGAAPSETFLAPVGDANLIGSWNRVNDSEGERITLTTLDAELDRLGLASLDLWKIDMEGYELQALQGATRSLREKRIGALYVEATGESGRASLDFIRSCGYQPCALHESGRLLPWEDSDRFENALCLPTH